MNNIKRYRIEKGMTLEKLSDITGLSAGYLCHLEVGRRNNPTMQTMIKISNALDKSVDNLFFE